MTLQKNERKKMNYSPIFILGLPRTGSTLLYQLCAKRFKTCYLSNFMMKFPDQCILMAKISYCFFGCTPPNNFNSHYGETKGWRGVNQGYKLWSNLFPKNIL